ncbi:MBL fold metallo-hydrolase [Pedobacter yulinensis]|uniref:MBL fold metallo-hydrolase n=1 Tax=Pedobacter yulinensis TaxID=2126353 RepID=A0A2T3HM54_9SPHI|nr:MBL fold metallo-hydrolase [Pedobacter yulinensis]PST83493.1 MBL fold metallo-hydrolase [Pedobacter yulinensis]
MKITFLGTGTSQGIPVITCPCEVCHSTDPRDKRLRVSVFIETGTESICIDSGPDFRYQMLRAGVQDLDAIIYTHEHKDHIAGLDDIRPFNYLRHKHIDIYAVERVQQALKREFSYIFAETKYPGLPQINLHEIHNGHPFAIGSTAVRPFRIMHHLLPITGYRIGGFVYITDAKMVPDESFAELENCDVLVINALQRQPHISHFTFDEALAFAARAGAKRTYLTHMSHNLGKHADVESELPDGVFLAHDGLVLNLSQEDENNHLI